jgi:predicted MFS family arabinose efflux permease
LLQKWIQIVRIEGSKIRKLSEIGDFGNLIVYEFFKNFALSILGIFIPILIYSETQSLLLPGIYLLVKALTGFFAAYPVMKVINERGFRSGLSASYIFLVPSVLLIYLLQINLYLISAVAVLYSIGVTFHTESRDLEFAKGSNKENRDMQAAHLNALPNIGRLAGPAIGGLVSAWAGFNAMLLTALAAILISLIPARNINIKTKTEKINLKSVLTSKNLNYSPVFLSRGIQAYAAVAIFSLFTYVFIAGDFASGFVRSMDTLGFMIMAYFSGLVASKYSRFKIIAAGALISGLTYLLRIVISTPVEAFLVSILGGLSFKLYDIPLFSDFADRAEEVEERSFYTAKKTFNSLGKILTSLLFIGASIHLGEREAFNAIFILAAISTTVMTVTQRYK